MSKNLNNKNTIKSAYKVFELLEILTEHRKLSLNELSTLTGFTKSTTQRIVNTLKDLKYIVQDNKTLEYYPSIKLYQLGSDVINYFPIKNIAKPHLLNLYKEVEETVNLAILNEDKDSVIYLDKFVSTSPLRVELEIGSKFPIYSSALGKAIAAFSDETYTFDGKYIKHTKNTISSDEELYAELENVRKLGYAIDNEEYIEGLICIAVPIFDNNKKPIASISISTPVIRCNKDKISYYVTLLKDCADKIKNELF